MIIRQGILCACALLLAACGSSLPAPSIRALSPSEIEQGEAPLLRLEADAVFPFTVDYGAQRTGLDTEVAVRIGGLPVSYAAVGPEGIITAMTPFGLPVGALDVVLELGDGRTATLPGGFTVRPGRFPDAFTIDPIADQVRKIPFAITVHAQGDQAAQFKGVVQLRASQGAIAPTVSNPFEAGSLTQQVSVTAPNSQMVITVEDAAGHTSQSNPFRVGN